MLSSIVCEECIVPLVVNVIGIGRKSGKTSLIEALLGGLSKRGYKVATVKHISKGSFDTAQKDTWKHLQAGAVKVIAMSPNEMVSIHRINEPILDIAVREIGESVDIILVEGFKNTHYPKIIVAQAIDEVKELMKKTNNVLAISGPIAERTEQKAIEDVKILKPYDIIHKIVDMIHKQD